MSEDNTKRYSNTIRFELCDNTFWLLLWTAIGVIVLSCSLIFSHYYTKRVSEAFKHGYEEGTVIGAPGDKWVKVK